MEAEFIDWTTVLALVVLMFAVLKLLVMSAAMSELKSEGDPLNASLRANLAKLTPRAIYQNFTKMRCNGFSVKHGLKRSWKIQAIIAPFWIVAMLQSEFFEFAILFGIAAVIGVVAGMRFGVQGADRHMGRFA